MYEALHPGPRARLVGLPADRDHLRDPRTGPRVGEWVPRTTAASAVSDPQPTGGTFRYDGRESRSTTATRIGAALMRAGTLADPAVALGRAARPVLRDRRLQRLPGDGRRRPERARVRHAGHARATVAQRRGVAMSRAAPRGGGRRDRPGSAPPSTAHRLGLPSRSSTRTPRPAASTSAAASTPRHPGSPAISRRTRPWRPGPRRTGRRRRPARWPLVTWSRRRSGTERARPTTGS